MLILRQKFRSCMLGYYIRSCHVITCNTHEMWGLIYSCAMRTLPMSCHRTCSDIMHALGDAHMQASQPPYVYMVRQELLMDVLFVQAKQYLSKLTASHFSTLNVDFANWNMLKRLNENKADWNENFRICAEEAIPPLYKW